MKKMKKKRTRHQLKLITLYFSKQKENPSKATPGPKGCLDHFLLLNIQQWPNGTKITIICGKLIVETKNEHTRGCATKINKLNKKRGINLKKFLEVSKRREYQMRIKL